LGVRGGSKSASGQRQRSRHPATPGRAAQHRSSRTQWRCATRMSKRLRRPFHDQKRPL